MQAIAHQTEFELYHYDESLCSQMVRIALEEKNIDWTSHRVSLNEMAVDADNLKPEYLSVNPKGLVPTLVHNGTPVYDSWVIINYLDEARPDHGVSLTPRDADLLAQMQAFTSEASLDEAKSLGTSLGMATPALTLPVLRHCIRQQPLFHFWWKYRKHPLTERRWGARMARLMPPPKSFTEKSITAVGRALAAIETTLTHGGDYLIGDYSQADIMVAAHFHRLEDVALGSILTDEALPNIAHYWQRLQDRPAYQKAVIEWHDPQWRAALDSVFSQPPTAQLVEIRNIALATS